MGGSIPRRVRRTHLESLGEVDGFILKGRAPSCGIKDVKVYPGAENSAAVEKGAGFFGAAVLARYSDLPWRTRAS